MRKHVPDTRLTRQERQCPQWVEARKRDRPDWVFQHQDVRRDEFDRRKREYERGFTAFVLHELYRRELEEIGAAYASLPAGEEAETLMREVLLCPDAFKAPESPPRGRGRPEVDPVKRQFHPPEYAARIAVTVREIFEDYWSRINRPHTPTAEQIAAEYTRLTGGGTVTAGAVKRRIERSKQRRPI